MYFFLWTITSTPSRTSDRMGTATIEILTYLLILRNILQKKLKRTIQLLARNNYSIAVVLKLLEHYTIKARSGNYEKTVSYCVGDVETGIVRLYSSCFTTEIALKGECHKISTQIYFFFKNKLSLCSLLINFCLLTHPVEDKSGKTKL
jgi:hypothetical protein